AVTAGGMFHLPGTRKAMPDDASVAVPRANGLGWVDVRDHGATGDGVTDDRAAVVAAANLAAEATDRSTLYFPAGTYLINDGPPPSIGDNVTVVGEGAASVLKRGAGATYFALLVNRDYAENTAGNRNIAIHNLSFDANGANQDPPFDQFKHCIALIGVRNAVVRGCRFFNLSGDGVVVSSTSDATDRPNQSRMIRIVENDFEGGTNGRNGISIIDAADVVISSNTFTGVAADTHPGGIDLEPDLPGQDITNVIVVGNTFENCRQGFRPMAASARPLESSEGWSSRATPSEDLEIRGWEFVSRHGTRCP
ncbi:MAG: right-handed parallel beta-helix repeat-containing protein, partial [Gemmatimonadetes bacterium]|nr:right-handed parallel beta-helix repeat-containing protein [Gemmatimonadota bacterium]